MDKKDNAKTGSRSRGWPPSRTFNDEELVPLPIGNIQSSFLQYLIACHKLTTPTLVNLAEHRSNFNITGSDLYDLFGKYGAIRQIRLGTDASNLKTKGTAYVVYESPDDAKDAITHLNGFHLMERYIVGE